MSDSIKKGAVASAVGVVVNLILMLAKIVAGVTGHSAAMIADAVHSASDVVATAGAYFGLRIGRLPADNDHPYGHHRIETEITRWLGIILVITGVFMGWSSLRKLLAAEISAPGSIALWAALASVVIKEALFRYTLGVGRQIRSSAIVASAWDHRSDAFSSIAVLIGIGGARLGLPALDPLAGIIVSLIVVLLGAKIYWEATGEMVDRLPSADLPAQARTIISSVPGVEEVQDIKGRKHGPGILLDVRLSVNKSITVEAGHRIAASAKQRLLDEIDTVSDVLIHVNPSSPEKGP